MKLLPKSLKFLLVTILVNKIVNIFARTFDTNLCDFFWTRPKSLIFANFLFLDELTHDFFFF